MLIITVMVGWLLLAVFRGRLHPIGGLGVALGVTVLLFPVVQPWYLLWAIIPLAAWATRTGFRIAAIVVTLVVGIFGPTANGDRFALFQIVDATVASTVIVLRAHRADATPACRGGDSRPTTAKRPASGLDGAPVAETHTTTRGRPPHLTPTLIPRELRRPETVGAAARGEQALRVHTAVSNLDLEVHAAEVLALLGPNGAGKTTTVEMCEGFVRPDAGTIEVLGLDPIADNARLRERASASCCRAAAATPPRAPARCSTWSPPTPPTRWTRRGCWTPWGSPTRPAPPTDGSPADSSSGSRWPARWSAAPNWSSSTSRPRAWTPTPGCWCGN